MSIPDCQSLSPWHLIKRYVALTHHGQKGGPLLLACRPPYNPLDPNSVGSITKRLLAQHGIPSSVWAPHSTRGAGVKFWKRMGLSSEEVCEIGKWKDIKSFAGHYLRLGAQDRASELISGLVHSFSPGDCAEPHLSRTPGSGGDPGGRDKEGEAHELLLVPDLNRRISPCRAGALWPDKPGKDCRAGPE